jgi:tripartite-type tricarboxylate transporter receptor subunit TctC
MQEPAIKTQLLSLGQELTLNTPEEFVRFIQADREKWAKVVKESGTK